MSTSRLFHPPFGPRSFSIGARCAWALLIGACRADGTAPNMVAHDPPLASVEKVPVELIDTLFVPCAGQAGEAVEVQVREQLVTQETVDTRGRLHVHFVINDKGTTGKGLTSGTTYHMVGATHETDVLVGDDATTASFGNALNLIGDGASPNLTIHETFHLTINANGVTVVEREVQRVECK